MRQAWMLLFLATGCPGKDTGSTDDSTATDDTSHTGGDDTSDDCPSGPGVVDGVMLGSDGVPLASGTVRLYDSTGSEELVSDNVDTEGNFHLVYGRGEYVIHGEYATCVSEDIAVSLCGDQTVYQNINMTCAP